MGTPVARVDGRGERPLLAVVGHIDEIAVLVSHVTKEGYLKVVSSGGWDPQILVGQRVQVLDADGTGPGRVRPQADPPARGGGAQEGGGAEGPPRGHRRRGPATRRSSSSRPGDPRGDRGRAGGAARAVGWPRARSTTGWACTSRSRRPGAWATAAAAPGPWRRSRPCRRRSGRSAPARWRTGWSRTWRSWST